MFTTETARYDTEHDVFEKETLLHSNDSVPIHHYFICGAAGGHAQKVAAVLEDQCLSYAEILHASEHVALQLLEDGSVKNIGDVICQCVERSIEMIIGIMSILMAGAVYCPLTPAEPQSRLESLVKECRAACTIVHPSTVDHLPKSTSVNVVPIIFDAFSPHICEQDHEKLHAMFHMDSASLAIIIFTSGSTGKPKGIQMSHTNFVSAIAGAEHAEIISKNDIILQRTPVTFDMHLQDILGSLILGSCLIVIPPGNDRDLDYIANALEKHQVTCLSTVPTVFSALVEQQPSLKQKLSTCRLLLSSGEALQVSVASALLTSLPANAKLMNGYGPAECTLCSTVHIVTENDLRSGTIPIGRPDRAHRCFLSDENLLPTAAGEIGELFVGGPAVFGAYLNRPDLTTLALCTVPNQGEGKFYRTGDLVRMDVSSNLLYFIGRKDFQIKLRGQRIEPGEIENVIASCVLKKPITRIAVLKKKHLDLEHLVAYVESDEENVQQKLRMHCDAHLPQYMIPSLFVSLIHFPLSENGKLDRKALPEPDFSQASTIQDLENFEKPLTKTEYSIAHIWQELLGIDAECISTTTNFFSISGNSLLLMRLVRLYEIRLCRKHSFPSMVKFFPEPTIQRHGHLIDEHLRAVYEGEENEWTSVNSIEGPASQSQMSMYADAKVRFSSVTDTALNNVLFIYKVQGSVNVDRLHQALNRIIFKQAALRTSLYYDDDTGELCQRIMDFNDGKCYGFAQTSVNTHAELLSVLSDEKKNKNLLDESIGLVFRCHIVYYHNSDTFVCFNFHYVAADGESHIIFAKELQKVYQCPHEELELLHLSYMDYARHQWRTSNTADKKIAENIDMKFWKSMFDNTTSVAFQDALPYDRVSSNARSGSGYTYSTAISTSLAKQIHDMARNLNVTLADVTLAAFYLLLFRLTLETDMYVGVPYAHRNQHSSLYDIIGTFVHVLPIRCQLETNKSFTQLVTRVRTLIISCVTHVRPYMHILRHTHCGPLKILCQIEWTPWHERVIALDETNKLIPFEEPNDALFDILCCFDIGKGDDNIQIKLNVSTDVFEKETVSNIAQRLVLLLTQLVYAPNKELFSFSILLPHEINLVESLLDTSVACEHSVEPRSATTKTLEEKNDVLLIHCCFAHRTVQNPQKMAVLFDTQGLSYAEVLYAAQEMAARLLHDGCVKNVGDIVCQCVEKSIEMIIGIMAILMSGGVYCPLSSEEPKTRLERQLMECVPSCVLVHSGTITKFSAETRIINIPLIIYDIFIPQETISSSHLNLPCFASSSLAFVIFTSGSTGRPKGVCLSHRNFTIYLKHELTEEILLKTDTVLQRTPVTFSMHLQETVGSLWTGSSVVLIRQSAQRHFSSILNAIAQHQISYVLLTPVLLSAIFKDTIDLPILESLRLVQTAGEPLKSTMAARALACLPLHTKLVNAYGQTEAPLDIWHHEVTVTDLAYDTVTIGRRPFLSYATTILDQYQQPVVPGTAGELCISGEGVFIGYFNRPEVTLNAMIKFSYNGKEGSFYKTGDLVRLCLASGIIFFIGRKDFQIKLRGQRIECGEIESVIFACAYLPVNRVVVVKREHAGVDYLVAYIEPEQLFTRTFDDTTTNRQNIQEKLRIHCQNHLPSYMVPSLFILLRCLPLNANGKLDRQALPTIDFVKELAVNYQASTIGLPDTEMEKTVHRFWQESLGVADGQISTSINFFTIGGNSLLLMHLVRLYETHLSLQRLSLPMASFFQMPTIREHASLLSGSLISG